MLGGVFRTTTLRVSYVSCDLAVLEGLLAAQPELGGAHEGFHARPRVRRSHTFAGLKQPPAGLGIAQKGQIHGLEDLGADDDGVGAQQSANHLLLDCDHKGRLGVVAEVVRSTKS